MPSRPVVVYDGECRFCRWSVARIQRLDREGQFEYLPRQAPGAEERFPLLKHSDFNTGLRLVPDADTVHVGADGVYHIYRRLPPLHRVAWLYRVPVLTWLFRLGGPGRGATCNPRLDRGRQSAFATCSPWRGVPQASGIVAADA